jgi:hypothetical protein
MSHECVTALCMRAARKQTQAARDAVIRVLAASARGDVREYFGVQDDASFQFDAVRFEAFARHQ